MCGNKPKALYRGLFSNRIRGLFRFRAFSPAQPERAFEPNLWIGPCGPDPRPESGIKARLKRVEVAAKEFPAYAAPAVRRKMLNLIERHRRNTVWRLLAVHNLFVHSPAQTLKQIPIEKEQE